MLKHYMQWLQMKTKGNLEDQNFNPKVTSLYVLLYRNCRTQLCFLIQIEAFNKVQDKGDTYHKRHKCISVIIFEYAVTGFIFKH